jgi:type II restriction enzyme
VLEENRKLFEDIERRYYFLPIKKRFENKVRKVGAEKALSYLTEVMQNSTANVEQIIQEQVRSGKISDAAQARKAIAGNAFQGLVAYALIYLQSNDLINRNLVITLKPKNTS